MPSINDSKCVLVVGATAGIGRALALSIAELPSRPQVIAAGRRQERLDELTNAKVETVKVDIDTDSETLRLFIGDILDRYPDLDTVVFSAGVEYAFDFKKEIDLKRISSEININYTAVVSMVTHLLPHFLKLGAQGRPCTFIAVTSGLAIIPGAWIPNYSATKAALHSYTTSLRVQLQGTNVHVVEILPPLVESELHDYYGSTENMAKFWTPLDEFTRSLMDGLKKGDTHVSTGYADISFNRFESGKEEIIHMMLEQQKLW